MGVVLFILLGGYHPFDPDGLADDKKMAKAILACRWAFDDPAWDEVHHLLTMAILAMTALLTYYGHTYYGRTRVRAMAALLAMPPPRTAGERRGYTCYASTSHGR